MDPNTIIEALRGTMDPALHEAMERQLNEAHKSLNFVSTLLQITMSEQLDLPVRQAGSVAGAHGPSCSVACGIFPDQGSNPYPLH
uniref:Importin N-terminal domain-containing protein n=1 Tax=Monodon monoceros TaxID=40151 RepID=A0A8C6F5G5_MONMO